MSGMPPFKSRPVHALYSSPLVTSPLFVLYFAPHHPLPLLKLRLIILIQEIHHGLCHLCVKQQHVMPHLHVMPPMRCLQRGLGHPNDPVARLVQHGIDGPEVARDDQDAAGGREGAAAIVAFEGLLASSAPVSEPITVRASGATGDLANHLATAAPCSGGPNKHALPLLASSGMLSSAIAAAQHDPSKAMRDKIHARGASCSGSSSGGPGAGALDGGGDVRGEGGAVGGDAVAGGGVRVGDELGGGREAGAGEARGEGEELEAEAEESVEDV
eukprot:CAMPEP_0174893426 /NCGR_PEP_ID=MMETSP0167-20121228/8260_1 /TAXON_ID=38298 /ORGANISM="Rhodella maculata, Strain CCMP736" /LENGTH=271 /DNA_ID=CAMNT_0016132219 /DNA_START=36 /DNA_END=852 /DNA_ORIENTATION=-